MYIYILIMWVQNYKNLFIHHYRRIQSRFNIVNINNHFSVKLMPYAYYIVKTNNFSKQNEEYKTNKNKTFVYSGAMVYIVIYNTCTT